MPKVRKETKKLRLEDQLILVPYIGAKLGMKKVSEIIEVNDVQEGFDSSGRSYIYHRLVSGGGLQISEEQLRQYDDNIRGYVEQLSKARGETIRLKYFQHLALLFTEIYLDEFFSDPTGLLNRLFALQKNLDRFTKKPYSKGDLKKVAFWMATGSGKTLLMHINLWQIQRYNKGQNAIDFENIILVTPNEGLSNQHIEEMQRSGLSVTRFKGMNGGYFDVDDSRIVKVIEITKLKLPEDKRGEGDSVDVSIFGERNLIFVDEGHKGQRSEERKWMRVREVIAKRGFTFEYSATFGQIIGEQKAGDPTEELVTYAKSILFDYSYKYFHGDGFGKDFRLLNIRDFNKDDSRTIMLANAISFYEQLRVYRDLGVKAKEYNIEQPLWVFLGHRVQEEGSDLELVVRFFMELLEDSDGTLGERVKKLLDGQSGLIVDDKDVFARRYPETVFPYLRKKAISSEEVVAGFFREVFGLQPGAGRKLHLVDIKRTDGELGLKASNAPIYFGVINIGNKADFRKLVEAQLPEVVIENDMMQDSLFSSLEAKDSPINVLIGAKKFIEGWNCWRVSTMGLMNVGKGEGPQIIQLFGRGVRLKGKEYALKRSKAIMGSIHPEYIEVLETLGIFGIQANYLNEFKRMLELEEVAPYITIELPIRLIEPFPEDLKILQLKQGVNFSTDCLFELSSITDVMGSLNALSKVYVTDSRAEGSVISTTNEANAKKIAGKYQELLDWDRIYLELLSFRAVKQWNNMSFTKDDLKQVISNDRFTLYALKTTVEPSGNFENLKTLEDIVIRLLHNYIDRCYQKKRNEWEKRKFEIVPLNKEDKNIPTQYLIQIEESATDLIARAEECIKSEKVYTAESRTDPLPNAYYEGHIYQPLLAKADSDKIVFFYQGLNEKERQFVNDLAFYLSVPGNRIDNAELFLLRNLTRGKGIGFFSSHSFYPDFILWIKRGKHQQVVFIEPHGMVHSEGIEDPKTNLHKYLKEELEPSLNDKDISFDSFIISVTPFDSFIPGNAPHLQRGEYCLEHHLLFMETRKGSPNPDYIKEMFSITLTL